MSAVIIPYPRQPLSRLAPSAIERRGGRWLFRVWVERAAARRRLSNLDLEQLRDTGLDPQVVRAEALKPFWRA